MMYFAILLQILAIILNGIALAINDSIYWNVLSTLCISANIVMLVVLMKCVYKGM